MRWAGLWCAEKQPDYIISLGDWADMESLSSYDKGTKSFEGRRYSKDIASAIEGMNIFMRPIKEKQEALVNNHRKHWNPKLILTLGNHENRIDRAINSDSKLDGLISTKDLEYEKFGWEVIPYLQVVEVEGIAFCHYFVSGVLGRPVTSARMLLQKHHMSRIAGHQQGKDIAYGQAANGKAMTGIISGSFYLHEENYLTAQNNIHWRGIWQANAVNQGSFDELPISIDYLREKFSGEDKVL